MNDLFSIICYTCSKEKECSHAHLPGERLVGCGSYRKRHATNADRIRAMSDEELAEWLYNLCCIEEPFKCPALNQPNENVDCKAIWFDWLKRPVEVEE